MTSSPTDQPVRGPVGMPAHLWELAKSDVRLSVPGRVRNAVANGMNAPEGVRRIAARVAASGAALGVPAALIALGGFPDAADTPVDLAGSEAPLDGFDGAPAMPGSYDGGSGPGGGHGGFGGGPGGGHGGGPGGHGGHGGPGGPGGDGGGSTEGFASATTSGAGDMQSGLGTTWHVQDPSAEGGGDWLTVQMFQDVTVTETADGMFIVDAWQFIVIHDDDGNEYVFKEHYQVIVPDPPGEETDLIIHERGFVHVIERPDGTFGVETDFGIDVAVGADGDGRDEVGIGQTQHVRFTDTDGKSDEDVTVDLSERATSTSDDLDDKATTTIGQDQVFTDGDEPAAPFGGGSKKATTDEDDPGRTGRTDDPDYPDRYTDKDTDDGPDAPAESGTGGVDPSSPFGEEPADRGGTTGSPSAPAGTGTASASNPAGSAGSTGSGTAATTARPLDPAPLSSAAVAAPAASVLADEGPLASDAGLDGLDGPPSAVAGQSDPAASDPAPADPAQGAAGQDGSPAAAPQPDAQGPDAAGAPDGTQDPFASSAPPAEHAPFETPDAGTTTPGTDGGNAPEHVDAKSTPDDTDEPGDNNTPPGHDSVTDPADGAAGSPEPERAEQDGNQDGNHDTADHGTDGADHALVS